jgi:hypothetical protein
MRAEQQRNVEMFARIVNLKSHLHLGIEAADAESGEICFRGKAELICAGHKRGIIGKHSHDTAVGVGHASGKLDPRVNAVAAMQNNGDAFGGPATGDI